MTRTDFDLFENLPLPSYIADGNCTVRAANAAMRLIAGGEVAGKACWSALFGGVDRCPWCPLQKALEGVPSGYEWEHRAARRRYRAHAVQVNLSETEKGMLVTLVDITAEDLFAQRLRRSEKMEAIGQLTGGLAHDFKNILGAIMGFSEVIRMSNRSDAGETRDALLDKRIAAVREAAERANGLVDRLLQFARIGVKERFSEVVVDELLAESMQFLEHALDRRIVLTRSFSAAGARVRCDSQQLHTAIINIAVHARDLMGSGGKLHFATSLRTVDGEMLARADVEEAPGEWVEISVADNGRGMEEADLRRLLDPHSVPLENIRGAGLGIASVQRIVADLGGLLEVQNRAGGGTEYRILLPLSVEEPEAAAAVAETPAAPGGGPQTVSGRPHHVLVVDDEPLIRHTVEEMLSRSKFSTTGCADGREALTYFRYEHASIDLVLIDMVMPGMSGYDTYLEMKRIDPSVRVVLMTGDASQKDVPRMRKSGIQGFLSKPFMYDDLVAVVNGALGIGAP